MKYFSPVFVIVFLAALVTSCKTDVVDVGEDKMQPVSLCDSLDVQFGTDIDPLIQTNCALPGCHNSGSANGDYTTYAGLKAKVDKGAVRERVLEKQDMPPTGPLSNAKQDSIRCWLEAGAPNN